MGLTVLAWDSAGSQSDEFHIRHLKQHDAFNRTWWSVLSIDKLVTWQHLSIERIGGHVLLKASSCLRCLFCSSGRDQESKSPVYQRENPHITSHP